MSRLSFGQYGNYDTPQTFGSAGAATFILGQWWYDFNRLTTVNLSLFMGISGKTDGNGTGSFGLFINATNADLNIADLFGVIVPDLIVTVANSTAFHGYGASAAIVRPAGQRQILLAAQPIKAGVPDVTVSWRSAYICPREV